MAAASLAWALSACGGSGSTDSVRSRCEDERYALAAASSTRFATTGERVGEQQLVDEGRLDTPVEGYDLNAAGEVVPVPGSDCEAVQADKAAEHEAEVARAAEAAATPTAGHCAYMRQVLAVSVEAFRVTSAAPLDEEALVAAGILPEVSVQYDIGADGLVVAAPGGACERLEAAAEASASG